MNAGDLKERITIQYSTLASDSMGGYANTWADVTTVWAKAWTVSSSEGKEAEKPTMTRIQKFCIRYRLFAAPWRIKWGTRYFAVTGIDPENREWLYLTCKEAVK